MKSRLARLGLGGLSALPILVGALFITGASFSTQSTPLFERKKISIEEARLYELADPRPIWQVGIPPNSEQRIPFNMGATPRERALFEIMKRQPELPIFLKQLGEKQIKLITQNLKVTSLNILDIEAWPVIDDLGRPTWALARYRTQGTPWSWLEQSLLAPPTPDSTDPPPFLPIALDLTDDKIFTLVFDDALKQNDLYVKPLFGDIVWTTAPDGKASVGAWLPLEERDFQQEGFLTNDNSARRDLIARVIPQPARLNDKPYTFVVHVGLDKTIQWPQDIKWTPAAPPALATAATPLPPAIPALQNNFQENFQENFQDDFMEKFKTDVQILSGEKMANFPVSGRKMRFTRKNSADPNNRLDDVASYLEERYLALGLTSERQAFTWHGLNETNLIVKIAGKKPGEKPIVLGDHFDTAFEEDVFNKTGDRESAPGADDNGTATATLLRAAEAFKETPPESDVWLVHFTGEEFPTDCLGARHFVSTALQNKQDLKAVFMIDMIGWNKPGNKVFQVSSGNSPESEALALTVAHASKLTNSGLNATTRSRFDSKSYLYNTDGIIFSDAGYPVVLINEHLNALENIDRTGYHDTHDTSELIDWHYASSISKTVIEAIAQTAKTAIIVRDNP